MASLSASFSVMTSLKITSVLGSTIFKSQKRGAETLLKEVSGAGRFGVAKIRGDSVISIEEEPRAPKSDYAVIGVYLYDPAVLPEDPPPDVEITGVNNFYAEEGALTYEILDG